MNEKNLGNFWDLNFHHKSYGCLMKLLIVDNPIYPERNNSVCFLVDLEFIPGSTQSVHLLQFGTYLTQSGGQDDVSPNKLPQTILKSNYHIMTPML